MASLKESELRSFVESVRRYFEVTSRITPEITSAYLGVGAIPAHEYNGSVTFGGHFTGQVTVSLPPKALRELLLMQQETQLSDDNLLDAVGEIANTLAGNARRELGLALEISVPATRRGSLALQTQQRTRPAPYVITFRWNTYPGVVCVDLAASS
jgi:chemotaxis protein CheX